MERLPIQDTLSDDHLEAIGLAIAQWASLEALMAQSLCDLISGKSQSHHENVAPFMTVSGMGAQTKIGLLQTLVRLRCEADANQFDKLAKRMRKAQDRRDILAHSTWKKSPVRGFTEPSGVKTVGSVKILSGKTNAGGIRQSARHFYDLGCELIAFMQAHGYLRQLPSS